MSLVETRDACPRSTLASALDVQEVSTFLDIVEEEDVLATTITTAMEMDGGGTTQADATVEVLVPVEQAVQLTENDQVRFQDQLGRLWKHDWHMIVYLGMDCTETSISNKYKTETNTFTTYHDSVKKCIAQSHCDRRRLAIKNHLAQVSCRSFVLQPKEASTKVGTLRKYEFKDADFTLELKKTISQMKMSPKYYWAREGYKIWQQSGDEKSFHRNMSLALSKQVVRPKNLSTVLEWVWKLVIQRDILAQLGDRVHPGRQSADILRRAMDWRQGLYTPNVPVLNEEAVNQKVDQVWKYWLTTRGPKVVEQFTKQLVLLGPDIFRDYPVSFFHGGRTGPGNIVRAEDMTMQRLEQHIAVIAKAPSRPLGLGPRLGRQVEEFLRRIGISKRKAFGVDAYAGHNNNRADVLRFIHLIQKELVFGNYTTDGVWMDETTLSERPERNNAWSFGRHRTKVLQAKKTSGGSYNMMLSVGIVGKETFIHYMIYLPQRKQFVFKKRVLSSLGGLAKVNGTVGSVTNYLFNTWGLPLFQTEHVPFTNSFRSTQDATQDAMQDIPLQPDPNSVTSDSEDSKEDDSSDTETDTETGVADIGDSDSTDTDVEVNRDTLPPRKPFTVVTRMSSPPVTSANQRGVNRDSDRGDSESTDTDEEVHTPLGKPFSVVTRMSSSKRNTDDQRTSQDSPRDSPRDSDRDSDRDLGRDSDGDSDSTDTDEQPLRKPFTVVTRMSSLPGMDAKGQRTTPYPPQVSDADSSQASDEDSSRVSDKDLGVGKSDKKAPPLAKSDSRKQANLNPTEQSIRALSQNIFHQQNLCSLTDYVIWLRTQQKLEESDANNHNKPPLYFFWDNASMHFAKKLTSKSDVDKDKRKFNQAFDIFEQVFKERGLGKNAKMCFVPKYNPQFNPCERVFAHLKNYIRTHADTSKDKLEEDELLDLVERYMDHLAPHTIARIIYGCKYRIDGWPNHPEYLPKPGTGSVDADSVCNNVFAEIPEEYRNQQLICACKDSGLISKYLPQGDDRWRILSKRSVLYDKQQLHVIHPFSLYRTPMLSKEYADYFQHYSGYGYEYFANTPAIQLEFERSRNKAQAIVDIVRNGNQSVIIGPDFAVLAWMLLCMDVQWRLTFASHHKNVLVWRRDGNQRALVCWANPEQANFFLGRIEFRTSPFVDPVVQTYLRSHTWKHQEVVFLDNEASTPRYLC